MSSDALKKQMLTQKLLRNLKNKQKSAKISQSDKKTEHPKQLNRPNTGENSKHEENGSELTK